MPLVHTAMIRAHGPSLGTLPHFTQPSVELNEMGDGLVVIRTRFELVS